jgi:hypothetical protein
MITVNSCWKKIKYTITVYSSLARIAATRFLDKVGSSQPWISSSPRDCSRPDSAGTAQDCSLEVLLYGDWCINQHMGRLGRELVTPEWPTLQTVHSAGRYLALTSCLATGPCHRLVSPYQFQVTHGVKLMPVGQMAKTCVECRYTMRLERHVRRKATHALWDGAEANADDQDCASAAESQKRAVQGDTERAVPRTGGKGFATKVSPLSLQAVTRSQSPPCVVAAWLDVRNAAQKPSKCAQGFADYSRPTRWRRGSVRNGWGGAIGGRCGWANEWAALQYRIQIQ